MWTKPVSAPAGTHFGKRGPYWSTDRDKNGNGVHTGTDFPAAAGTPIRAVADGMVIRAEAYKGNKKSQPYGNQVRIRHKDGLVTLYAHMTRMDVRNGDMVAAGLQIGTVGDTGNTVGAHLHFEVHHGAYWVDPMHHLTGAPVAAGPFPMPGASGGLKKLAAGGIAAATALTGVTVASVDLSTSSGTHSVAPDRLSPYVAPITPQPGTPLPLTPKPVPVKARHAKIALHYGPGSSGQQVLAVRTMLIRAGMWAGTDAKTEDGPQWTQHDTASYALWQKAMGYHGKDADGVPGPVSLHLLTALYGEGDGKHRAVPIHHPVARHASPIPATHTAGPIQQTYVNVWPPAGPPPAEPYIPPVAGPERLTMQPFGGILEVVTLTPLNIIQGTINA